MRGECGCLSADLWACIRSAIAEYDNQRCEKMVMKKIVLAAFAATAGFGAVALPAYAGPVLVIKQVPPEYPRGAERRELEGTVDLKFVVDDSGKVASVEVVGESTPGVFDKAATKALKQWKFEAGQPGDGEITIAFKLS